MKLEKISKYEALRLVTPVIDGEVCNETREVFFEHVKEYPEVNYHFKSAQCVKQLLKRRCPKAKTPSGFYERIKKAIAAQPCSETIKN